MIKYICMICGYTYLPEEGDPDSGIGPDTPFEEIPDTWACPECHAAKRVFQALLDSKGN